MLGNPNDKSAFFAQRPLTHLVEDRDEFRDGCSRWVPICY